MNSITPRKLLILDLDETLIHARKPDEEPALHTGPDFTLSHYQIWKRPFLTDFLTTVRQWYDLAVWTSSNTAYATSVVPQLFATPADLRFVWARNRCTQRIHPETQIFYWHKNLSKVKRHLQHPLEHIVMLDDSPEKLERHYGNLLTIAPFEGQAHDTELRDILPYLHWLSTAANIRTIEKRFWRTWRSPT